MMTEKDEPPEEIKVVAPSQLQVELDKLKSTIDGLEEEEDQKLLTRWIKEWSNYISFKSKFDPKRNIAYKAGYVARVNFGQNIGSEQGGKRPAVILEDNNRSSPVVTVIPLSSLKDDVSVEDVEGKGNVYLGELSAYNNVFNQGKGTESIALLSQIRAISKMRIGFPTNSKDEIIKLDPTLMSKIYVAIRERYATPDNLIIEEEKLSVKIVSPEE